MALRQAATATAQGPSERSSEADVDVVQELRLLARTATRSERLATRRQRVWIRIARRLQLDK